MRMPLASHGWSTPDRQRQWRESWVRWTQATRARSGWSPFPSPRVRNTFDCCTRPNARATADPTSAPRMAVRSHLQTVQILNLQMMKSLKVSTLTIHTRMVILWQSTVTQTGSGIGAAGQIRRLLKTGNLNIPDEELTAFEQPKWEITAYFQKKSFTLSSWPMYCPCYLELVLVCGWVGEVSRFHPSALTELWKSLLRIAL